MDQFSNQTPINPVIPNPAPTASTPTQHSPKSKTNNKPLIIGIVICAVLALAGIASSIYNMVISNNKSTEISNLKAEIAEKDQTIANLTAQTPSEDDTTPTPDTPTTNSYEIFADNLAKNYSGSIFGYYYHYTGTENVERTVLAKIDQNHHLVINDLDDNNQLIAEADNIISAYFVRIGNGGTPYFYMLNKDGTVSRICLAENADRTIENLNDYKNIVSVIEGSDLFAYLIDINGNVYQSY